MRLESYFHFYAFTPFNSIAGPSDLRCDRSTSSPFQSNAFRDFSDNTDTGPNPDSCAYTHAYTQTCPDTVLCVSRW